MASIEFTIIGRPISKKNSKRILNGKGHPIVLPSKAYKTFEGKAVVQLMEQNAKLFNFTEPVMVTLIFKVKGKYKVDVDNLAGGILDILELTGILADDNLVYALVCMKYVEQPDWTTHISIRPLGEGGEKNE